MSEEPPSSGPLDDAIRARWSEIEDECGVPAADRKPPWLQGHVYPDPVYQSYVDGRHRITVGFGCASAQVSVDAPRDVSDAELGRLTADAVWRHERPYPF